MPDDLIGSFIDRGLYSPEADDAGDRLALLTHYAERGITIDMMVEADAAGRLQTLSGDLLFFDVGPELTIEEVAERCAIGIDRVLRIRLASGLPTDVDTRVPSWTLDDVTGFTLATALFGEPATLAFSRVMGAGAARLADAAVSLFLTEVDTSLLERHAAPIDWALANEEAARLVDVVASINAHLLREHLALAIRRQRSMVSPGQGAVVRTTIGFVDLARSTEWASSLSPLAQAGALAVFESAAWDIATRHGGRIVKLIGDEVMFTVGEPAAACDIALELCAAVSAEPSLPSARAAIGFGEVAFRDGDFYGPLVHVVARAVKAADEGAVVADAALRERCEAEGSPARFEALEPQELRGVPEPVVLHVVTPAAGDDRRASGFSMTARPSWEVHLPPGLERAAVDLLTERTLVGSWLRRAAESPAHPVVFDDEAGWVSAEELEDRSRAAAAGLASLGLERRDRVLVSGRPSVELVVAHVAALRLGLVVTPVNPALSERELRHVVADAAPRAALVAEKDATPSVAAAVAGTAPVHDLASLDATGARAGHDPPGLDEVDPDDEALLLYTSGTTGSPKGAPLTHANLLASAEALRLAWRWTPDDRLVLALPLFHLHGLGVGLYGTLCAGASTVLRPRFSADDVLDAAVSHGASLFFGVPTMYGRLAASGRAGDLSRLRLCVSGSAPLPPMLFHAVESASGQRIVERYGMTETVMNVSNPCDGERRPGTVGIPLPQVDVALDDRSCEILVRGPNVFAGYLHRPDATAESFVGGWFHTGDAGDFDEAGYLQIVGRLKELIITGGFNVYPREVEEVLRSYPGVLDAAVVGVPSDEWGEQVAAFVEGDVDPDELGRFAGERLAPYKRPTTVQVVAALPRNALGKVVKAELGR